MLRHRILWLICALGLLSCPKPPTDEVGCVDAWLKAHGLDEYGHPQGTMYSGGTPLFDEATGQNRDRLEYIYSGHTDAKAACHR